MGIKLIEANTNVEVWEEKKEKTYIFIENIKRHWTPSTKCGWFGHNINCK